MPAKPWPFVERRASTQHLADKRRLGEPESKQQDKLRGTGGSTNITRNKRPVVDLYGSSDPKPKKKRRNLYDDTSLDISEDEYQDGSKPVNRATKRTIVLDDGDLPDAPIEPKQQLPARRVPRLGEPLSLFRQQEVAQRKPAGKDQSRTTTSTASSHQNQSNKESTEKGNSSPSWKQKRPSSELNAKLGGAKTNTSGSVFNSSVVRSKTFTSGKSITRKGNTSERKGNSDTLIDDLISSRNQLSKPNKNPVTNASDTSEKSHNARSDKNLRMSPEKASKHSSSNANRSSTSTIDANRKSGVSLIGNKKPASSPVGKRKPTSPDSAKSRSSVNVRKKKKERPQLYDVNGEPGPITPKDKLAPKRTAFASPASDSDGDCLPDVLQYVDKDKYDRRETRRALARQLRGLGAQQARGKALGESLRIMEQRIAEDSLDAPDAYQPPDEFAGLSSSFDGTEGEEPDHTHPAWKLDLKREMVAIKHVLKGIMKGHVPSDRHDLFFRSRKDRAGLKRMETVQDWPRQCVQEVGEILVGWFCGSNGGTQVDLDRLAYVLDVLLPEVISRLAPKAEEMVRREANDISDVIVIE